MQARPILHVLGVALLLAASVNEAFREFMAGEKVTRTCVGATPHRKGVNVEIDCVARFD